MGKRDLRNLLEEDPKAAALGELEFIASDKDPNHVERRQQQRAISLEMIKICLIYGSHRWIHGALTYTITDRSLQGTRYEKHIDTLRGLRVVTYGEGKVKTTYWYQIIKRKKPAINNVYSLRDRSWQQRRSLAA